MQLTPKEFLEYTPQELSAILFFKHNEVKEKYQLDWERTRIQTYFLINIQIPKNKKLSYDKFRRDYWPFIWDENKINENPDEGVMEAEDWFNIIKKPIVDKGKVSELEMKSLK